MGAIKSSDTPRRLFARQFLDLPPDGLPRVDKNGEFGSVRLRDNSGMVAAHIAGSDESDPFARHHVLCTRNGANGCDDLAEVCIAQRCVDRQRDDFGDDLLGHGHV